MIVDPNDPTIDELEACFVNNAELNQIGGFLNRFNPIRVMRMERMEIRHSAVLAWLLDPIETHGFGDRFLKAFLSEALKGDHQTSPTALDVLNADLSDSEVLREKQNIDIFISSARNGWSFVVENKFHSTQSEGQLERYRKHAETQAREMGNRLINRGIFLTLSDEKPDDETYVSLYYRDICLILSNLIAANNQILNSEVLHFLNHYLDVIKEAAEMNEDQLHLENIAKSLYRKHKKAIDFVIEHGKSTDFTLAVDSLFGEDLQYGKEINNVDMPIMFDTKKNHQMSFLPIAWRDALGGEDQKQMWKGCEKWWAQYPVMCWFQLNIASDDVKGTLFLYAEVGPLEDFKVREQLIKKIEDTNNDRIQFRVDAKRPEAKYSKFLKKNNLKISDVSNSDEIAGAMKRLLKSFKKTFEEVAVGLEAIRNSEEEAS